MYKKKKAHIFNIDNLLIRLPQRVWIIEKNNPNECLLRIPKEDYDLIKTGVYKDNELSMKFNGRTYWLSKNIFEKLKKQVKKLASSEELSFSFREYTDPETIQDLKVDYDLSPIEHLKNLNDDVYFISTKGTEKKYGQYYTKLIDQLKDDGIMVNQVYYLNQSYFSQSKDKNIKKICYTILSNVLNKNIKDDELKETLDRNYSEIYYYDTNYVTINKINSQINSFLKRLGGEDTKCKLFLNLVGSNLLNPFTSTEVKLNRYIQTFENFAFFKKKAKSVSENKITEPFSDHNDSLNVVIDFLNKNNLKFKGEPNTYESNLGPRILYRISVYNTDNGNIFIINFYENINENNIRILDKNLGYIQWKPFSNIKDIIDFISLCDPTLINNRIFKKLNENVLTDRFYDMEHNLTQVKIFLDKSDIDYKFDKQVEWKNGTIAVRYWYCTVIYHDEKHVYDINVYKDYINILFMNPITRTIDSKKCYNMMDVIKFISEKTPSIASMKALRKINENKIDVSIGSDLDDDYSLILKFLRKNNIQYYASAMACMDSHKTSSKNIKISNPYNNNKYLIITLEHKRYEYQLIDKCIIEYYDDESDSFYPTQSVHNLKDIVNFISENMPEIVSFEAIKKINENKLTEVFSGDLIGNVKLIKEFLDKNGIKYELNDTLGPFVQTIKIFDKENLTDKDDRIIFKMFLTNDPSVNHIEYSGIYKGSYIALGKIYCIKDIINYISEHIPELINTGVFKKINENKITDEFKNPLDGFNSTIDLLTKNNIKFESNLDVYDIKNQPKSDRTPTHSITIMDDESGIKIYMDFNKRKENNTIHVSIPNPEKGTSPMAWQHHTNLKDIIDFISKHNPSLINREVFKKINT